MAGRVFAFADASIIKLLQTEFIPVCTDDWYTRRRKDAEGKFFRIVSDQTRRKESQGATTRQGIYTFTADGETLNMKNAGQDVNTTKQQLEEALAKFKKLPESRRLPGTVTVPAHGPLDAEYSRTVPEGGLVLKVHARILEKSDTGFRVGKTSFLGGDKASRDFAWFTAAEVKKLLPTQREVGYKYRLDDAIARRICRFHLIDNTRGEPPLWSKAEYRRGAFSLVVSEVKGDQMMVNIEGEAELASDADYAKADRGYLAKLSGQFQVDVAKSRVQSFQLTALGDHWGAGGHTLEGVRPGRSLLGITFDQVDTSLPQNRVSPQGVREIGLYYGRYDD